MKYEVRSKNPQPITDNSQPKTHNRKPTTENPQPKTHNRKPTTENPQPKTHNRKLIRRRNHNMRTVRARIHQPGHAGGLGFCGQPCAFARHIGFVDYVAYLAL